MYLKDLVSALPSSSPLFPSAPLPLASRSLLSLPPSSAKGAWLSVVLKDNDFFNKLILIHYFSDSLVSCIFYRTKLMYYLWLKNRPVKSFENRFWKKYIWEAKTFDLDYLRLKKAIEKKIKYILFHLTLSKLLVEGNLSKLLVICLKESNSKIFPQLTKHICGW